MRAEDVKSEWIDAFMHAFYRSEGGMIDTVTQSLAAVAPLIRAAALEEAALEIDCGCERREQLLSAVKHGHNSAARWAACSNPDCAALSAAVIRALKEPT